MGAKHSANMDAFGPAFLALEGEPGAVERFFTAAANRLVKPSLNDSMTFADFVVAEFTGRVGYSGDAASFRFNHGMKKIKPETATELAWQYAELGAALGAIYPHVVRRMFDLTYAAVPKHAWKLAHASGLDIPPVQGVISYEEAEEGEDEVFMAYCLECCPELQAILKADYQEDHEGLLDVPNTARAEDEGIREKMLAYRRAINDVIDIDNILLSTCRHMFSDGYGPSGLLVCAYADVLAKATVENSRSRSEFELPSSAERIRQAIIEVAGLAITKDVYDSTGEPSS